MPAQTPTQQRGGIERLPSSVLHFRYRHGTGYGRRARPVPGGILSLPGFPSEVLHQVIPASDRPYLFSNRAGLLHENRQSNGRWNVDLKMDAWRQSCPYNPWVSMPIAAVISENRAAMLSMGVLRTDTGTAA